MADLNGRSRNWAFIIYPESMPENWLEILRDLHLFGAVSPLHDKDINPDGSIKKSHYHVLLKFPSKKSFEQIYEITQKLGSNVFPQVVDNFDGYFRYLIHEDNPEKYHYEPKDITPLAGIDVESFFAPTKSTASAIAYEIKEILMDNPEILDMETLSGLLTEKQYYVLNNYPNYVIRGILNKRTQWALAAYRKENKK